MALVEPLAWLARCEGHGKHTGAAHPTVAGALYLALLAAITSTCAGPIAELTTGQPELRTQPRPAVALALTGYVALLVVCRVAERGAASLYEIFWGCNVALVISALGLLSGRPMLVAAAMSSVCVDQVMWYVDVAAFALVRRWPIGAAKYLVWPDTTWARRATSLHHLWFIPLALAVARGAPGDGLPRGSFALSLVLLLSIIVLSRLLTPYRVPPSRHLKDGVYLNANLVYECWPDVRIAPLHWADHTGFATTVAFLFAAWGSFNGVCYALIDAIARVI